MRKPDFITFTGADEHTDLKDMIDLSVQYPIEWGILFSPSRQGKEPRYPGLETIENFVSSTAKLRQANISSSSVPLRLAAHLCGQHARDIMAGITPDAGIPLTLFDRIQVNHDAPDIIRIKTFSFGKNNTPCIAQTRDAFPESTAINWLFDASGGRGIAPKSWLPYPGRLVGYAGGLGPANVKAAIEQIDASGPYWIDMESGVRTDDKFDLSLCRQVCEQVYPELANYYRTTAKYRQPE